MALKKCKECGNQVSTSADKCPNCGAPVKRKSRIGCLAAFAILIGIGLVASQLSECKNQINEKRQVAQRSEAIKKQRERELKIQKEKAEKHKQIVIEFNGNKETILSNLESLIRQKDFDSAQKEIAKYDIPELSDALAEIKNNLEEKTLYEKGKKIPANKYTDNYYHYVRLAKINPDNKLYKKKLNYYGLKVSNKKYQEAKSYFNKKTHQHRELQKALIDIQAAIKIRPNVNKYKSLKNKLKWQELRYYKGNDKVQMALQYEGHGKFYVWIKNTSSRKYHVNPNDFTLVGKNNQSYHYERSDGIMVDLQPGTETSGYISFATRSGPREMVFDNFSAGKISRKCP